MGKLALLLAIGTCLVAAPVPADAMDDEEQQPAEELIHSDVPLFGDETSDKWPQHFSEEDGDGFGCASRVKFGDWILRTAGDDMDHPTWYRIRNYGVFHCLALVSSAWDQRDDLNRAESKPSFFVLLDTAGKVELWALQMGGVPGSSYLLLSRNPDDGIVESFSVLQRACPKGSARKGPSLDIIPTGYCAINSAAELRQLARQMLRKKPLGTLTFVEEPKEVEEEEE